MVDFDFLIFEKVLIKLLKFEHYIYSLEKY